MKRLNPKTNKPFTRGDVREDGRIFKGYVTTRVKKDGYFIEEWLKSESMTKHKQTQKACAADWYERNKESVKQRATEWNRENSDKHRQYNNVWRAAHREQHNAINRRWRENNLPAKAALEAKRRAAQLQRTPTWLDEQQIEDIADFYTIAKMFQMYTGELYHVDHILPLQGKKVSGLHVPDNLQVIPAKDNLAKSNKH